MDEIDTIGEALRFEWDIDEQSSQIWDAMQLAEHKPSEALTALEEMAKNDSRLAMICLGDLLLFGLYGCPQDTESAEHWLRRAAELRSIEGRFRLANLLELTSRFIEAEEEYLKLAELDYAPAMYVLAFQYWYGKKFRKDRELSVKYFNHAIETGHLYAEIHLAKLQRRGEFGFSARLIGFYKLLKLIVPVALVAWKHPKSDLLRR